MSDHAPLWANNVVRRTMDQNILWGTGDALLPKRQWSRTQVAEILMWYPVATGKQQSVAPPPLASRDGDAMYRQDVEQQ